MTDNTKSDQKPFIKEFAVYLLPHKFVRTSFLFLFRPRPLVNEFKANNWSGKSRPVAFLVASLAIAALFNSFIGAYSTDPEWYESVGKMDDERGIEFRVAFPFTLHELQTMPLEVLLPGQTAASRRIEETVGSLKVSDIADHLERANSPKVARALTQGADQIKKYARYVERLIAPVLLLAWAIGALIIHRILRQDSESYRIAFYLVTYVAGIWIMFSHLVIAFGSSAIPYEFSWLSLLFVSFEVFLAVASLIHGSWVCGFVYNRGIGRRLLAYVLANGAVVVVLVAFAAVLTLVVDYLP